MSGRSVTILLVVWLAWASLLVPSTEALPNHVVAGGLFGPGGRVDPGALNPANSAGLVLYSTSQPSHSLVVGGDAFTAADGTNPAFWAADVGSPWNWMDGDIVVGVLETVRGLGGWTDVNYTASIQGILRTGPTVQDFGNGTLEALPPVSVSAGANSVDVSWPALSDPNGNVASYELYHAVSPAGPFSTVARVSQGAFPAHNHTGLGPGIHCYNLAVNYRRDGAGAVYTTTGRSEIECVTIADVSPRILATDPQAGQANVSPAAPVVVTFSEAMDVATVTWSIGPSVVLVPVWSAGDSVLTLNHTNPFTDCSTYTVAITAGRDLTGNNLVPGLVPNPWPFTVVCPSPYIVSASPANGTAQVRNDARVVITFSETMNTTSVGVTFSPSATSTQSWNTPVNTTLTLLVSFAQGTRYTVTITGRDPDENALVAGPVPNPFAFTTNTRPSAAIDPSSTLVGVCRSGGFDLVIPWSMSDVETSQGGLVVWLNATGALSGTIADALTGLSPPFISTWSTPNTLTGNVRILLVVADEVSERGQAISGAVEIDSQRPTVTGLAPSEGATSVPTNTPVEFTFSEAMNRMATEAAIAISPPASASFAWSVGDTVLTITAGFNPNTVYSVRIRTGARDECSPGLSLASDFVLTFATASGPKLPNPPSGLRVTSATSTAIALSWDRPGTYNDGSIFTDADVVEYRIFRATSETGGRVRIATSAAPALVDTNVTAGQAYYYSVTVVDRENRESPLSEPVFARAETPPRGEINALLVLGPLIVILLILGILLLRRTKPAEPPASPPEQAAKPKGESVPGASPEEPAGAGDEDFVACPNCSTMVKPTDAECSVCGSKL